MKTFDGKKKVVLLSVLSIFLLIGTSYAIWQLNFTQESSNTLSVACFSITYSEQDNISLLNTYPMLDSEGESLTPYQVTIKNNCDEYGAYQVNLEVLNTTTLDSGMVKVMFDDGTPKLLTSYTAVEKTLSDATSAYKMTIGFLNPNEEKTYTLRLWIDENVTLEDHVEGKRFASKITIVNTYKSSAPTSLEECELIYGYNSAICNIVANGNLVNDVCLDFDSNGMLFDSPIYYEEGEDVDSVVCSTNDEYGPIYYLRGNHQDNNVKFANSCWKIIRTTGTGGIKLLYNGDTDQNGTCTTTDGEHMGYVGDSVYFYGDEIYGTGYIKEGDTYTLTGTSTFDLNNDSDLVIGKYTCGNMNNSCEELYVVLGKMHVPTAENYNMVKYFALRFDDVYYSQIGIGPFNNFEFDYSGIAPAWDSSSPALVGYMFNDLYVSKTRNPGQFNVPLKVDYISKYSVDSSFYGDSISYSNGTYYLSN